jgi:excisionase family DNA binding protein
MTDRDGFSDGEGRWLSITEAAELTGRHRNTIRNWILEGRLRHVREEPYSGGTRYLLLDDEMQSMIAIPGPSSALPTTRGGWDRLVAQVRGLAELAGEGAEVQRRLAEAEAEVERLEAENRELRERLGDQE